MEVWHIWAIVALIFIIVEIFTYGFAVICLGFGCIAASIASACGAGVQIPAALVCNCDFSGFPAGTPACSKVFQARAQRASKRYCRTCRQDGDGFRDYSRGECLRQSGDRRGQLAGAFGFRQRYIPGYGCQGCGC